MITAVELMAVFLLDALLGDPRWMPHPVRWIGTAIARLEGWARNFFGDRTGGIVLTGIIVAGTWFSVYIICGAARGPQGGFFAALGSAVIIYLGWSTVAMRDLLGHVSAVFDAPSLEEARRRLSMIVGRDTSKLDEQGVRRAAVECLAESLSDGVVAPLFYMALGGVPLALAYKAVNTLDSMIGYKNEKYMEFGRFAARLDDAANYLPARITGWLIVLGTYMAADFDAGAARAPRDIMRRDGHLHTSPNAGIPEAAMAGALGVRLGGPSVYGGTVVDKPWIHEEGAEIAEGLDRRALFISGIACVCAFVLAFIVRGILV